MGCREAHFLFRFAFGSHLGVLRAYSWRPGGAPGVLGTPSAACRQVPPCHLLSPGLQEGRHPPMSASGGEREEGLGRPSREGHGGDRALSQEGEARVERLRMEAEPGRAAGRQPARQVPAGCGAPNKRASRGVRGEPGPETGGRLGAESARAQCSRAGQRLEAGRSQHRSGAEIG